MNEKDRKMLIIQSKKAYKKIGSIPCPAFNGETVVFDQQGFRHLIQKYGSYRPTNEQRRRLGLISRIERLVRSSDSYAEYRERIKTIGKNISYARFWSLVSESPKGKIIVIIRQINNGRKHFFSVMD